MVNALARSCNVYFFRYAEQIGSAPLIDWGNDLDWDRFPESICLVKFAVPFQ